LQEWRVIEFCALVLTAIPRPRKSGRSRNRIQPIRPTADEAANLRELCRVFETVLSFKVPLPDSSGRKAVLLVKTILTRSPSMLVKVRLLPVALAVPLHSFLAACSALRAD
jgi:hypothetical protein